MRAAVSSNGTGSNSIKRRILVGSERFQVNCRGITRHGNELLPRDEPTAAAKQDQFPDSTAVPGDGKGLPVLNGVHDLPRLGPHVALRDLWLSAHLTRMAPRAIEAVALPMIAAGQESFSGRVRAGPRRAGKFRDVRAGATRVPFACSLRVSHVPRVMPVPSVTHPSAKRRVFVDDFGLVDDCGS
jgi:hypothetical protein